MSFIEIKGLRKTYGKGSGELSVLNGIELEINKGDSIAVTGASGAGKSTLLSLMGTLDRPTGGDILYSGSSLLGLDDKKLAAFRNSKVGFVFQFHHLLPEFTALENVMLPGLIAGEERDKLRKRAEGLLGEAGLQARLDHKPGELSGGEQQRVAVMRALMRRPEIILADEPTGNLDRKTGEDLFDLLLRLNTTENITIVMVTHNDLLASKMKRSITLVDGLISE